MITPDFFKEFARKHNLAVEQLTENQFAEAIRQMIACGDFIRYVQVNSGAQQVVYIPFAREQELQTKITELEKLLDDAM